MGRNLVWETVGRVSVVVHGRSQPTTLEWEAYINYARTNVSIKDLKVLVRTHGGSPDAEQRKTMADMARQDYPHPPRVAMVTGSVVVRAVMAVSTVFNPYIKCFAPDHMSIACAYLGLDDHERTRATLALERLEKQVD
jgi:hypothetical protein